MAKPSKPLTFIVIGAVVVIAVLFMQGGDNKTKSKGYTSSKKVVKVSEYYNTERLRPYYSNFEMKPFFLMAAEY